MSYNEIIYIDASGVDKKVHARKVMDGGDYELSFG